MAYPAILFFFSLCGVNPQSLVPLTKTPEFVNLFSSAEESGVSCYRIPSLVTAPNGDLIAAIDERVPSCGDLKWSRDINIVIRRSSDNGSTWSPIEKIVDYPLGESASDPSMIVDHITGEIFLFFNYMNLDTEKDVYYLQVIKSQDNGQSWTTPEDITKQISKSSWHNDFKFITSGRGIQTASGDLVHTMVNLDNGMHLFKSKNHGESWELIDTPVIPGNESKIVELNDGTWMINSRMNGAGIRYVHTSSDHGLSWKSYPDSSLIDPGCNASIIRYDYGDMSKKGMLLFSNANNKEDRKNLTIKLSTDNGMTWKMGGIIYPGEAAYSTMTILKNGNIGVLFEKDGYQKVAFTSISLKWLVGEH